MLEIEHYGTHLRLVCEVSPQGLDDDGIADAIRKPRQIGGGPDLPAWHRQTTSGQAALGFPFVAKGSVGTHLGARARHVRHVVGTVRSLLAVGCRRGECE